MVAKKCLLAKPLDFCGQLYNRVIINAITVLMAYLSEEKEVNSTEDLCMAADFVLIFDGGLVPIIY